MADDIGSRNAVALDEPFHELDERFDLRLGEGLEAGVVELDADRDRIQVGMTAPP
ncbi:hypothetical protein D3C83_189880 [compost metagenome]